MFLVLISLAVPGWGQSLNGSLSGKVTDPSHASVPGALVTVQSVATGVSQHFTTGPDGLYTFPNLLRGTYNLTIEAKGFRKYEQLGIIIDLNARATQDVGLVVGATTQTVEVTANASPLNKESGVIATSVPPATLEELPLTVSGGARNAAQFVEMAPGVTSSAQNNMKTFRFAGGIAWGDEALLDGITMTEGLLNPAGMVALSDYPLSPDAIGEISVLTNNYDVQYGASTGGVVSMETKSGTNQFHGDLFEFGRNSVLNATAWNANSKPYDNEHEYGGTLGGPLHVPHVFWGGRHKTYFFELLDAYRISGGASPTVTTLPTAQERQGNFSDWVNGTTGALIPIYDPATTVANPAYTGKNPTAANPPWIRTQFAYGGAPNVIPPSYPNFAFAQKWIQYLPTNTNAGITSNYQSPPIPSSYGSHINESDTRVDEYFGSNDHFMASVRYSGQSAPTHAQQACVLPLPLCGDNENVPYYNFQDRASWDHTFSPTVINHFGAGYSDFSQAKYALDSPYVSQIPAIANVAGGAYPPELTFGDGYAQIGNNAGLAANDLGRRPAYILNDVLSWSKGKHLFKMGGEVRFLEVNQRNGTNLSGTFGFTDALTGAYSNASTGNSFASFITGAAGSASSYFCYVCNYYARSRELAAFWGDTWKTTPRFTLSYGLRWDADTPIHEKNNDFSFFNPNGVNSAAGGLLGTLAYAGTGWGAPSFGRNSPGQFWLKGFGPRLGLAYNMGHNTVVRGGYGIFFGTEFNNLAAINQTGFSTTVSPPVGTASVSPAIWMQSGWCQTTGLAASFCGFPTAAQFYTPPPFVSSTLQNGKGMSAYSFTSDALPYAQQFTFTLEHAFSNNLLVNATYTGTKGTRLQAGITGFNVLNPSYLTGPLAGNLKDTFPISATSKDGVPIPYPGWQTQLAGSATATSCSTCTVAQALLPYPQFTGTLFQTNENDGNSFYNGLSIEVTKRTSHGLWLLANYNVQKNMGTVNAENERNASAGIFGNISQYLRNETWAVETDDVPQTLRLAVVYDLPFDHFTSFGTTGFGRQVLGGWEVSTIYMANGGIPFQINSTCGVPGQFAIPCTAGMLKGVSPFAQPESSFDPSGASGYNHPLLNINAFEPASYFSANPNYYGQGPLVEPNLRQPGYDNEDASIIKTFPIKERFKFQLRADFLDMWNWHSFTYSGSPNGNSRLTTNVSTTTTFGRWSGSSFSGPRVVIAVGKLIW
jgi:hypothetical protein